MVTQKEQPQVFERAKVSDFLGKLLPVRERGKIHDQVTLKKFETVLPKLMEREQIDMWIIACREHNEDPVMLTMLPTPMTMARRRTILVFYKKPDGAVERMCIVRPNTGIEAFYENKWANPKGSNWANDNKMYKWSKDNDTSYPPETEYECLARLIKERDPKVIGIDISEINAYADGLTVSEYRLMKEAVPEEYQKRFVSAEKLAIGWLETRLDEEIYYYNGILQMNHGIIAEAFSSRVIHPCLTTCDDVEWWIKEQYHKMHTEGGAHVSVMRPGEGSLNGDTVILPGDIVHCDVGFQYLDLWCDVQENGYVLKWDEENVPEDLLILPKTANRLEDIFAENFKAGLTGNEILKNTLEDCKKEHIVCRVFTHPIGNHGHAAGPTIGLTDQQGGVPGNGDLILYDNTCYSMEFSITEDVETFGGPFELGFETNVAFHQGKIYYLGGRQSQFHLIK